MDGSCMEDSDAEDMKRLINYSDSGESGEDEDEDEDSDEPDIEQDSEEEGEDELD